MNASFTLPHINILVEYFHASMVKQKDKQETNRTIFGLFVKGGKNNLECITIGYLVTNGGTLAESGIAIILGNIHVPTQLCLHLL
jgi:hypothetical protein